MICSNCTPIAVIGIGCLYPGAKNPLEFWENILARKQQFREMPIKRLPLTEYYDPDSSMPDKFYQSKASVLDNYFFNWLEKKIPKQTFESTDIVHWLALDIALEAIKDAGYTKEQLPENTTGVIIGNTLTGEFTRSNQMRLRWPYVQKILKTSLKHKGLQNHFEPLSAVMEQYYKSVFTVVNEDTLAGGLANTIAGRICNFLDIHGGGYTVDGACASSLLAVCTAANHLHNKQMDLVIAGGIDISLDTFELIGFSKTGALTPDEMRVYDRAGKGFIPGEGCGMVLLKRLEEAEKDKDQIYAVLNGWGISSDGKGGLTAPSKFGQSLALQRAYQSAAFNPLELDFIEGHGTGTKVGDQTEIEGINLALKPLQEQKEKQGKFCGLTSLKSIIGHTKAAAGIGAFLKTVIALNQRILPPSAGLQEINPAFKGKVIYPLKHGQLKPSSKILKAGVSAMGFGGINSHVLLASYGKRQPKFQTTLPARALMVSNQVSELFLWSAENQQILKRKLEESLVEIKGMSYGELVDYAYQLNHKVNFTDKYRAGLVAENPFDLTEKLEILLQKLGAGQKIENPQAGFLNWAPKKIGSKIAFLFPGQGSQKLNMTYKLIERFTWAQELSRDLLPVEVQKAVYQLPELVDDIQTLTSVLRQTQLAQPAIVFASLVWFKYLQKLEITPQVVLGHSLGELMAFYSKGFLTEKQLLDFASYRGYLMSRSLRGAMISLACGQKQAEDLIQKKINGYVVIANLNAPNQTVLSGEESAIKQMMQIAESQGINAVYLPVGAAFHSKFMQEAADAIAEHQTLAIKPLVLKNNLQLISSLYAREIEPKIDLQAYFAEQALGKVDFANSLRGLQVDLCLEVGTGKVLSSLAAQQNLTCLPLEPEAEDDRAFNKVLLALFMEGMFQCYVRKSCSLACDFSRLSRRA